MPSQVYYRKWRPRNFKQLIGQEHVARTLRQAISQDKVAHAYLFSGPRGTGKTTTARILSKAINCSQVQEGEPCNHCATCSAANEGRFMDLIELDAASNRGIDDIRSIREKVNLAPAEGKYKSYIIDEAHMLTSDASNAFLKTLEEPPPHTIFILCTTDPQKLLPTVLSRCQRFAFRRLSLDDMVSRLTMICGEEGLTVEEAALRILAKVASGSLRDAENLLEQVVISYGPQASALEANEMLGNTAAAHQIALETVQNTLQGKTAVAIAAINRGILEGVDLRHLHHQVVEITRSVLLIQCGIRDAVELPSETLKYLDPLASKVPIQRVVDALKLIGGINLKYDAPSPLPLELAVVEASLNNTQLTKDSTVSVLAASESREPSSGASFKKQTIKPTTKVPSIPKEEVVEPTQIQTSKNVPKREYKSINEREIPEEQWKSLVKMLTRIKGKRFNIGALLRDCKSPYLEDNTLVLNFLHRSHLERMQEELDNPLSQRVMEQHMKQVIGHNYKLKLILHEVASSDNGPIHNNSPLVRAALALGARIVKEKENNE